MPKRPEIKSILIIGSGPIIIGQACEFDYSGTQALRSIREDGIETILINSNPATIMTDPSMADHVYLKPLTTKSIIEVLKIHKVDAVLPTMGGQTALNLCIEADDKGIWEDFDVEIIIIDNGSKEDNSLEYLNSINNKVINNIFHKVIIEDGEFNFSYLINSGARKAKGNVLLLLNNDIEIIKENWANYLVSNALRPSIGCVGAKLVYDDLNIQHAGVILGIGGYAGHSHKYLSSKLNGYQNRLTLQRELSAVTGALSGFKRKFF